MPARGVVNKPNSNSLGCFIAPKLKRFKNAQARAFTQACNISDSVLSVSSVFLGAKHTPLVPTFFNPITSNGVKYAHLIDQHIHALKTHKPELSSRLATFQIRFYPFLMSL
jgi:hypothetical protein